MKLNLKGKKEEKIIIVIWIRCGLFGFMCLFVYWFSFFFVSSLVLIFVQSTSVTRKLTFCRCADCSELWIVDILWSRVRLCKMPPFEHELCPTLYTFKCAFELSGTELTESSTLHSELNKKRTTSITTLMNGMNGAGTTGKSICLNGIAMWHIFITSYWHNSLHSISFHVSLREKLNDSVCMWKYFTVQFFHVQANTHDTSTSTRIKTNQPANNIINTQHKNGRLIFPPHFREEIVISCEHDTEQLYS